MTPRGKLLVRYAAQLVGLSVALAILGSMLVRRDGGGAQVAMVAGCVVALLASVAGAALVLNAKRREHVDLLPVAFGAMAVRLGVVVVLAGALSATGLVAPKPLWLWAAIGHAVLMIPDTMLSIEVLAKRSLAEDR